MQGYALTPASTHDQGHPLISVRTTASLKLFFVAEEGRRDADDEGRGGEEELLGTTHAGGQERDDGEHVLQGVDHGDEGQHGHGERIVVPGL